MNCTTFDSVEILANTAGRMAMYEHIETGVPLEFMFMFVETLNEKLREEGHDVCFKFNAKILQRANFLGSTAYIRSKKDGRYYVNKYMLYKVLAHMERSTNRVVNAIYGPGHLKNNDEMWGVRQPIRVFLSKVFIETKKRYDAVD